MCIKCGGMQASGMYGLKMFETLVILGHHMASLLFAAVGKMRRCHTLSETMAAELKQLGYITRDHLHTVFCGDLIMQLVTVHSTYLLISICLISIGKTSNRW